jgi:hypothetical protein
MLATVTVLFILSALVGIGMAVRAINSQSGTTGLRTASGNSVDIVHNTTTHRLHYKDDAGTVQQVVVASDTNPFSAVDGSVNFVEVTLTNAQIKAVRATPVQLVAAPGAGKRLKFMGAYLELIAGTNVLTESTANLGIKYTDGSGVQVNETVECTGFIDQAVNTETEARPKLDPIVASSASANKALVLHNLGAGEFGGNAAADATLKVKVWYSVVTA